MVRIGKPLSFTEPKRSRASFISSPETSWLLDNDATISPSRPRPHSSSVVVGSTPNQRRAKKIKKKKKPKRGVEGGGGSGGSGSVKQQGADDSNPLCNSPSRGDGTHRRKYEGEKAISDSDRQNPLFNRLLR